MVGLLERLPVISESILCIASHIERSGRKITFYFKNLADDECGEERRLLINFYAKYFSGLGVRHGAKNSLICLRVFSGMKQRIKELYSLTISIARSTMWLI